MGLVCNVKTASQIDHKLFSSLKRKSASLKAGPDNGGSIRVDLSYWGPAYGLEPRWYQEREPWPPVDTQDCLL
jgi:hypothetical protein